MWTANGELHLAGKAKQPPHSPTVLESALRTVFSEYGTILNIKVKRNVRMRGQAFITFDNIESATKALEVKGFPLFGKPLVFCEPCFETAFISSVK